MASYSHEEMQWFVHESQRISSPTSVETWLFPHGMTRQTPTLSISRISPSFFLKFIYSGRERETENE